MSTHEIFTNRSTVCKRCGIVTLTGRPDVLTLRTADDGRERTATLCRGCTSLVIDLLNHSALAAAGV